MHNLLGLLGTLDHARMSVTNPRLLITYLESVINQIERGSLVESNEKLCSGLTEMCLALSQMRGEGKEEIGVIEKMREAIQSELERMVLAENEKSEENHLESS